MSALSLRAERCKQLKKSYYFDRIFEAVSDPWSSDNPDGFILAGIAENGVSAPLLLERLQSNSQAATIPPEVLRYPDMKGTPELRAALCDLLQRTTMSDLTLAPENLVLSAGVSSVLDNLFFLLADDGASCLIPAPYYPMFDQDLGLRNSVKSRPIYLSDSTPDVTVLDVECRAAQAARQPVRAVMLTNPDNPTGVLMSEERIKTIIRWCVKKRVHCVVDEIYGWSVFPEAAPMRSALSLAAELAAELSDDEQEQLWAHVHIIIGFSKDFCMSGMRVGGLYSYNAELIEAYDAICHMSSAAHIAQWQLQALFADEVFIDMFIAQNSANLAANAAAVCDGLEAIGVPFLPPQGGFFIWMNLSEALGIDSFEREADMWNGIFERAKVMLVPGEACHSKQPGWYRICFSPHAIEAMHDLVARLKHFIDQYKGRNEKQSWSTQGFMLPIGFGTK